MAYTELPAWVYADRSLGDEALQERWVAGAREAVRRIEARGRELAAEMDVLRTQLEDARKFLADAEDNLARYRGRRDYRGGGRRAVLIETKGQRCQKALPAGKPRVEVLADEE